MTRCLALALACSCASDQLIQPVADDPSAGAARECVSVPPVEWPGPWDLEVAWHSAPEASGASPGYGDAGNVYGTPLLVPEWWVDPAGSQAPVIVFATPRDGKIWAEHDVWSCRAPCETWSATGLTVSVHSPAAFATSSGVTILAESAASVVDVLQDGVVEPLDSCMLPGNFHPLSPSVDTEGGLVLFGLPESCISNEIARGIATTGHGWGSVAGWGVVAPLPQGVRYLNAFEARDPLTGAWSETIGGPLTGVGSTQTLVLGNPPVVVEFASNSIHGRRLDGRDLFVVEDLQYAANGFACAGDLDGLPGAEFVVPVQSLLRDLQFRAYDLKGRLLWVDRSSAATQGAACATADLDGDGADEVVLVDEVSFRALDGRTGRRLFEDQAWNTLTADDHPVVADLDGDGSSEILFGVNSPNVDPDRPSHQGLVAFTHPLGILDGHAPFWPGRYMHHTNVGADGLLLAEPAPWWEDPKTDGQQRMIASGPSCPDLATSLVEVCTGGGFAGRVDVRIDNIGGTPIGGDVTVQLVGEDGAMVAETVVAAPAPGSAVLARLEIPWDTTVETWTAFVSFDAPGPHAGCENPRLAASWPVPLETSATAATE